MNKYAVMYKKERTEIIAKDAWAAKNHAKIYFGLTNNQLGGIGLEVIEKDKTPSYGELNKI